MKSEWTKVTLLSVCSRLSSGKSRSSKLLKEKGVVPVYGGNGVRGYIEEGENFNGECAIIGRQGAYCGNVRFFSGKAYMTEHAIVVQANVCADTRFLAYKLSLMQLGRLSGQSAQPGLSVKVLGEQVIDIPPLPIQRKIASILSALDDKIETNNAICQNLEEQARALYELWLSKRKNECEWLSLEAIADLNPEAYSIKEKWGYINYLDTGNITDGVISSIQKIDLGQDELPSRARRKVKAGDVVFSTVRPNQRHFGILHSPLPNMLVSTGFTVIRSNKTDISNELIYLLLSDSSFVEKMQQIGEQSVSSYPSVKPTDIATCQIPFMDSMDYFQMQKVICAMFSQSAVLKDVNRYLSDMRDTLLPKLMNGEIDLGKLGKLA